MSSGRLGDLEIGQMRDLRLAGVQTVALAALFGCDPSYVSLVCSGERRRAARAGDAMAGARLLLGFPELWTARERLLLEAERAEAKEALGAMLGAGGPASPGRPFSREVRDVVDGRGGGDPGVGALRPPEGERGERVEVGREQVRVLGEGAAGGGEAAGQEGEGHGEGQGDGEGGGAP